MLPVFGLLYTVLFFSCVLAALFIVFHFLRYSLNRRMALFATTLFLVVFVVLLISNAALFFSLPLDTLLPTLSLS